MPTIRVKMEFTIRETKPKKKKIIKSKTKIPNRERKTLKASNERGKKVNKMWEPSSGGIGKRLNTANRIFKKTMYEKTKIRAGFNSANGRKRNANPKVKAMARLEPGPAKLTKAEPYFPLRFMGLTGTGFAQPKIIPPPPSWDIRIRNPGKRTEPMGSK